MLVGLEGFGDMEIWGYGDMLLWGLLGVWLWYCALVMCLVLVGYTRKFLDGLIKGRWE